MENSTKIDIFFWWSIVSSLLALAFLGWDIWQLASSQKDKDIQLKEKELHKAQVKIWQHFASGINHNISHIVNAIRSKELQSLSAEDFRNIMQAIQPNIYALYTSLNEERLFSEEEIKQRQLEQEERTKKLLEQPLASTSPSAGVSGKLNSRS